MLICSSFVCLIICLLVLFICLLKFKFYLLIFTIITEVDINLFVRYYREKFSGRSFMPKFQLQNHVVGFMRKIGL